MWGLLQLHRLGVDLALANNNNNDNNANNAKDDHAALLSPSQQGTSVALPMPAKTDQEDASSSSSSWIRWLSPSSVSLSLTSSANTMTTLRIALTVIQSLGPVTHELFRVRPTAQESVTTTTTTWTTTTTTSSDGHYDSAAADTMKQNLMEASQIRRHARVQCYLERLRFLLRFILLVSYWKRHFEVQRQLQQQQQQQQQQEEKARKSNDTKNHSAFLRKDSDRRCRCEATVDTVTTTTTINTTIATSIPLGLQLDGGQYHPYPSVPVPTLAQEQARVQRRNYQGRRTGRTVTRPPPSFVSTHQMRPRTLARADNDDDVDVDDDDYLTRGTQQTNVLDHVRVMAGELLYIVRPLFQAEAEVRIHNNMAMAATSSTVLNRRKLWLLLLSWCLGLVMDTTSLWSLRSVAGIASSSSSLPYDTSANPATREEWHRRRMRLLLYLLRTPLWEQCSRPSAEHLSNLLEKVPLLGGLLARYFWDWLYYWKLYRAEEG